jgi:hypothetical protein
MSEPKVRRLPRGFAAKGPSFYLFEEDAPTARSWARELLKCAPPRMALLRHRDGMAAATLAKPRTRNPAWASAKRPDPRPLAGLKPRVAPE